MTLKMKPPQPVARPATDNTLLSSLTPDDFAQLCMELEHVRLQVHDVLYEPGEDIRYVYFPTSGCVSMVQVTETGTVEVGTIGFEGMVGMPLLLHGTSSPTRALVQIEGDAYRIASAAFLRIVALSDSTYRVLLRFALAFFNQVAQSVACNRLHTLEERCARWLLITHDRVEGDEFRLTQEFLSFMLGVHRPAVTLAAGVLQQAGYIHYSRGRIVITDRAGLEGASCGCYQATRDDYAELIGSRTG
ncbi:MAG TPA: Crp/Fnr family transcriptional regulator [Gemmatimonadaceae bacterium]|nr:Crp/Fnr family transcriptional regulator [Gemmatimonadaceae bacterium]